MKKLLNEVLTELTPSKSYETKIFGKSKEIIDTINKHFKEAKAILGGSGAKGTWLKTFDADIFVMFKYAKYKDKSDKISSVLEKFLKKHFKIKRLHGSRDYFQIKQGEFTFEIIPILEIKKAEQARNITDVSPLHSQFVTKHKKLANEMRLTKQFCKAARVYGAESHIRGFSGYVCEILTVYYGSFQKLLKAATKWKPEDVIDVKNYYKSKNVFMELNKSKLVSPLIVIDPVQRDRNAAAALDYEKFAHFVKKAKAFLKKPSKSYFKVSTPSTQNLKKKYKSKVLIFKVKQLNKKTDVAGAKALKAYYFIEQQLRFYDFTVKYSDLIYEDTEALFYYVLKSPTLEKTHRIAGPPLRMKEHAKVFKKKHKKTITKNKKLYAVEKRKYSKATDVAKALLKQPNVKGNVRSITLV